VQRGIDFQDPSDVCLCGISGSDPYHKTLLRLTLTRSTLEKSPLSSPAVKSLAVASSSFGNPLPPDGAADVRGATTVAARKAFQMYASSTIVTAVITTVHLLIRKAVLPVLGAGLALYVLDDIAVSRYD
jgi:hypothetical protein